MNLFERLPDDDKAQFHSYLCNYGNEGDGVISENHLGYFLRFWDENKRPIFNAFREQFILKKEVRLCKPDNELAEDMCRALQKTTLLREFIRQYKRACHGVYLATEDIDIQWRLENFVDNWDILVKNVYTGPGFIIPGKCTKDGRPLVINPNCKVIKMLGKIVAALNVEMPVWYCESCGNYYNYEEKECYNNCGKLIKTTGYEIFRQTHSQVLNQKQIKGNLCLSIHPLDYITMSDNECGWTSCMSWMDEPGDYRLGTIEMMNSPYVIVAYVESKDNMWVCGREWNSKRWRQLYIVSPEIILGNRQYPYVSDDLQGIAIQWIKELMSKVSGYGPYPEETVQLKNNEWNYIKDKRIHFNLYCGYMYNDIYDYRLAYVSDFNMDNGDYYDLNFSGPAVCTGCGDIIELDTVDAHIVQCRACDGHWRCEFCGEWHSSYDYYHDVNGYIVCDWCYHNELEACEICDNRHHKDNMEHVYIQFVNTELEEIRDSFNYNFHVSVCSECLKEPTNYEHLFGPVYEVKDHWGRTRLAFDIRNITDDGFNCGDLSYRTVEWLKLMQAAESDKERIELLEKIVY